MDYIYINNCHYNITENSMVYNTSMIANVTRLGMPCIFMAMFKEPLQYYKYIVDHLYHKQDHLELKSYVPRIGLILGVWSSY